MCVSPFAYGRVCVPSIFLPASEVLPFHFSFSAMSNLSASPKQPNRVTRYNPNLQRTIQQAAAATESADSTETTPSQADEPPADWMALASLILGVMGLMMRYKLCAWMALFACLGSITNMRKKDVFSPLLRHVPTDELLRFAGRPDQAGYPHPSEEGDHDNGRPGQMGGQRPTHTIHRDKGCHSKHTNRTKA